LQRDQKLTCRAQRPDLVFRPDENRRTPIRSTARPRSAFERSESAPRRRRINSAPRRRRSDASVSPQGGDGRPRSALFERSESAPRRRRINSAPERRRSDASVSPQGGDGPRTFGIVRAERVGAEEAPHQFGAEEAPQ
jgi:hypothetical protein